MKTTQFMSLEGLEVVVSTWDCGCWHESAYSSYGTLELLRFQACSSCWDSAVAYLDEIGIAERAQLTLPLPSPEGDRRTQ